MNRTDAYGVSLDGLAFAKRYLQSWVCRHMLYGGDWIDDISARAIIFKTLAATCLERAAWAYRRLNA